MNLWGGDKGSDTAAPFDEAFMLERSKGVTGSHQADLVQLGEVAFRGNGIAWTELSGINAPADAALDALVRRNSVTSLYRHETTPRPTGGLDCRKQRKTERGTMYAIAWVARRALRGAQSAKQDKPRSPSSSPL